MSEERATLEMIAPSVEEALEKGLAELGVAEDQVAVEVLDEGSKGVFGMGSRQARIRITVGGDGTPGMPQKDQPADSGDQTWDDETENTRALAQETVQTLLEKMNVRANTNTRVIANEEPDKFPNIHVDVTGDDLSYLIGKRAETLNALQFVTRMIVGKEISHAANIIVDVEGYRERRERSLRQMANKMADQVISSGRSQSLEPMPAAERRIIHIELQENDEVTTNSVGDDPRRKVTITPV